ncbi:MAG TPA: rhodanese-like domain-containing protein, partial [Polyangiaceae bacterium]|nr:rhodanese-like domain-containing protein [Polyangiaceae bacterium]
HPRGAYNVPFAEPCEGVLSPNPGFVREVAALFGRDAGIVIGCASGVRSLEAARLLGAHGFANLVEQRAGFSGVRDPFGRVRERGWREEGLPVSTGDELGRSHREIRARAQAQHR